MPAPVTARLGVQHAELRALCQKVRDAAPAPAFLAPLDRLLKAHAEHEAEEGEVIAKAVARSGKPAKAFRLLDDDHLKLRSLARDVALLRRHPDLYPLEQLARLALRLRDDLLFHMEFEERRVFPELARLLR